MNLSFTRTFGNAKQIKKRGTQLRVKKAQRFFLPKLIAIFPISMIIKCQTRFGIPYPLLIPDVGRVPLVAYWPSEEDSSLLHHLRPDQTHFS